MSLFSSLQPLPPDPIFGLSQAFRDDPRPTKVHLGVGAYRSAEGKPYVLSCIREAEERVVHKKLPKEYPPILGEASFRKALLSLLIPQRYHEQCLSAQTVGATAALRLAGEMLSVVDIRTIYLPNPTWPNHAPIFRQVGLDVLSYPYYDRENVSIDFPSLCTSLSALPSNTALLFHGCCHNPTGADLTLPQWEKVTSLLQQRNVYPLFDVAYHGFGTGLDEDLGFLSLFLEREIPCCLCYSFAKNMGLYGERGGGIVFFTSAQEEVDVLQTHVSQHIRSMYSSPPIHSARLVTEILTDERLFSQWKRELDAMRTRLHTMRQKLAKKLSLPYIATQNGLFSLLPLQEEDIIALRENWGIYLPRDGRINIAGLTEANIDVVVEALQTVKR